MSDELDWKAAANPAVRIVTSWQPGLISIPCPHWSDSGRWKPGRRERNFWKQRPEAKNPPERPLLSAETGNLKIGMKNPRRNGLFSIGDGFRGSGRLGGGVHSQIRTGLPVIWPKTG